MHVLPWWGLFLTPKLWTQHCIRNRCSTVEQVKRRRPFLNRKVAPWYSNGHTPFKPSPFVYCYLGKWVVVWHMENRIISRQPTFPCTTLDNFCHTSMQNVTSKFWKGGVLRFDCNDICTPDLARSGQNWTRSGQTLGEQCWGKICPFHFWACKGACRKGTSIISDTEQYIFMYTQIGRRFDCDLSRLRFSSTTINWCFLLCNSSSHYCCTYASPQRTTV